MELCTGDLGFSAAKTYDLEVRHHLSRRALARLSSDVARRYPRIGPHLSRRKESFHKGGTWASPRPRRTTLRSALTESKRERERERERARASERERERGRERRRKREREGWREREREGERGRDRDGEREGAPGGPRLGFSAAKTYNFEVSPHRSVLFSIEEQLLRRNVERFRGGIVCKAHRLLYHSTLGLRVTKKKKR